MRSAKVVFNKLFEALYLKVFVSIVVNNDDTAVSIELCSKDETVDHIQKVFETTTVNQKMKEFIDTYISESPYYYVSVLDASVEQGAIPICDKDEVAEVLDSNMTEYVCNDNKWSCYTSSSELYDLQRRYKTIGIDFVFSPFSILFNFFKDKIDTSIAMYLIIQEKYITISIFKDSI